MNNEVNEILLDDLTKLKKVRLAANLRILDISLSTDISIGNISNLENGNRSNPKLDTIKKRAFARLIYQYILYK